MQIVVGGRLVAYEKYGEKGQDFVILHGWAASGNEWKAIAQALAGRYRVWVLDLPGFGGSSRPDPDWGIEEYSGCVEKIFTKLNIKNAVVLGHSLGGRVGILLAARTSLVNKLVLVDAAGMEMKPFKIRLYKYLLQLLPIQLVKKVIPQSIREALRSEDYKSAGELHGLFTKVISHPLRSELEKIDIPTLIIWGEKDVTLPMAEAHMIRKGIKNSILRVVWGASHWPHLEKPQELLQILKEENV